MGTIDMTHRILMVEDEINLQQTLSERLIDAGFVVAVAGCVHDAKHLIDKHPFHLAILDVGLPDGSGFDVARTIREKHLDMAIVFLTAFGAPEQRVLGLELGAEDYIVKPFHFRELLLRIQNALKRTAYQPKAEDLVEQNLTIGEVKVDLSAFTVERDGDTETLSAKEAALLRLLYRKRGQAVSREEIMERVWADDGQITTRTVDNFISNLRKRFGDQNREEQIFQNIRGVGYRLNLPQE
ncbi:MAG: DNA-binding response regulator [Myxococcales bacterium]|nr:DNA-binding response regulator [Myxococcales bacterium]|tara:strand:- start:578 stop:1297 length:720 start_codon:yes stop_codon:yes gene_type:complete